MSGVHEQNDVESIHYGKVKDFSSNTNKEDLNHFYNSWSDTYDKDVQEGLEYIAPALAAERLSEKLQELGFSKDAHILDLGCGTGLVGQELKKCGYRMIDGVDLCQEMLKKAAEKAAYNKLIQGAMGSNECADLNVDANQYDATICIGVFTVGHVKGEGFNDLVHVLKPGGLACFTIRHCIESDPNYGYNEKMNELSAKGKWKLVDKYLEKYHKDSPDCWLYIYQKL